MVALGVRFLDLTFPSLFEGPGATVVAALSVTSRLRLTGELLVGLGLIGLYVRQAKGAGIVGLVGFVLALVGNELVPYTRWSFLVLVLGTLGAVRNTFSLRPL